MIRDLKFLIMREPGRLSRENLIIGEASHTNNEASGLHVIDTRKTFYVTTDTGHTGHALFLPTIHAAIL
jgi:hypothetical protein